MGTRETKKAATRQALVDAAERLFAEQGVEATTMDQIARAAGTSRTSVFNYFPYKEMILCEIGARYVNEIAAAAQPGRRRRRSVRAILRSMADAAATLAAREPAVIAAVARELMHPDPHRRRMAAETMRYPALVATVLDQLDSDGRLRDPKHRASYGRQLVDIMSGTLVRVGSDFPVSELRSELYRNIELFLHGSVVEPAVRA